jgi:lysophospholipase L1-like esterase
MLFLALNLPLLSSRATAEETKQINWIALGDSYSAGVGGSGPKTGGACHRDEANAYPALASQLLAAKTKLKVELINGTCLGQTTGTLQIKSTFGSLPQTQTSIVTITVGGNDIGFSSIVEDCLASWLPKSLVIPVWQQLIKNLRGTNGWCPSSDADARLVGQMGTERAGWDGLFDRLSSTYREISSVFPEAQIFVLSYPMPFPASFADSSSLIIGGETFKCNGISQNQAAVLNNFTSRLDGTIAQAVAAVNEKRNFTFVDWRRSPTSNPAGLCGSEKPDLNGLYLPPLFPPYMSLNDSFHPTDQGYAFAAKRLFAAIEIVQSSKASKATTPTTPINRGADAPASDKVTVIGAPNGGVGPNPASSSKAAHTASDLVALLTAHKAQLGLDLSSGDSVSQLWCQELEIFQETPKTESLVGAINSAPGAPCGGDGTSQAIRIIKSKLVETASICTDCDNDPQSKKERLKYNKIVKSAKRLKGYPRRVSIFSIVNYPSASDRVGLNIAAAELEGVACQGKLYPEACASRDELARTLKKSGWCYRPAGLQSWFGCPVSDSAQTLDSSPSEVADKVTDVTEVDLQTAEIPAYCNLPAQRLVQSKTTKGTPGEGSLTGVKAYGDIAGLGYRQALVSYWCTAGGTGWPEALLLVGSRGKLLASLALDTDRTEHAQVTKITMNGKSATVEWRSYLGCCTPVAKHVSVVTYLDRRLTLIDVKK